MEFHDLDVLNYFANLCVTFDSSTFVFKRLLTLTEYQSQLLG